ncbi:MAG: hypothetical protein R6X07_05565 [Desulfatiglandales bacterium]|jgi:hypothetical protein
MKNKLLLILGILAVFCLVAGSGTALAGGKYRVDRHGYQKHSVVVHHGQPRVVHKYYRPAYGRIPRFYGHPYRPAYVCRQPVIVKHAPVCAPLWGGSGFSIRFGF